MKVNINNPSPSLLSILSNPSQIITLDANFLIPPDRSKYCGRSFDFPRFKKIWLDPIFLAFPKLAIHESVCEELILEPIQEYVEVLLDKIPPGILVHKDSSLTAVESVLRDTIESKIYPHTNYDPLIDNKDDRGEVKSLSFIAVN